MTEKSINNTQSIDNGVGCCASKKSSATYNHTQNHAQGLNNDGCCGSDHSHGGEITWKSYFPAAIGFILLLVGLALEYLFKLSFFDNGWVKFTWYLVAYLPVGLPVLKASWQALKKGEVFTEFLLMAIATIGAFVIGEYPEGVAVMLFYSVGELFQTSAVTRAKNDIKALLDVRPNKATVLRNGSYQTVAPETVKVGDTIQVKVGEKIPLDGTLLSDKASLNTAALTGESKPQSILTGDKVLAGSINLQGVINLTVDKLFNDSSIARILELVQNATARKSKTELLVRKLAKIYTPIVSFLAIAICAVPYFFVADYVFSEWLYRALVFLVISCPCALVISIPLGYFGGLGAASKNGLLFKGATYLDQLTKVNTLVMDKTGTVTKGVFKIKDIQVTNGLTEADFMALLMAIESKSTHPIAKAIRQYVPNQILPEATEIKEIAGKGLIGNVNGQRVIVGNKKLMQQFNIAVPSGTDDIVESIILVGIVDEINEANNQFAGHVTLADELKEDAKQTIAKLRQSGISQMILLSGDKNTITQKVAKELGIDMAKGGLLPEDKLNEVEALKKADNRKVVAFVGDGINDAPVLAASDVGIAMGAMGSDVAIETADIIIQTDQPSKIVSGIQIGQKTQQVIWQNIYLAFGVKALVLILGAFGMATMWQAVFSDVGVALLAIINAIRLQRSDSRSG